MVVDANPARHGVANKVEIHAATSRSSMGVAIIACLRVYMHILQW